MPIVNLTARHVAAAKPPATGQLDLWDRDFKGFGLRLSAGGRKAWYVRYRVDGERRLRRMSIGGYPALSLADAREKARAALRDAERGTDPAAEKVARTTAGTFADLADEYLKRHAMPQGHDASSAETGSKKGARRGGKKSWKEDRRIINNVLLAKDGADWKHIKVRDLTRPTIRRVFESITDRGAPVMANRTLALVSKMLNFALSRDWIDANPAALIEKNKEESRARVLSDDEIRELWAALGETTRQNEEGRHVARLNATLNDAFRMRFYTAQRGAEVFRMRWADVDLQTGWWEMPGQFTKNAETHRVPLITPAVELLAARLAVARPNAIWVFENVQPSKIAGRQFGNVAARGKKAAAFLSLGDGHLKNQRARTRKREAVLPGLSFQFQAHDIRRTASTNMTKAGVRRDDVSKVLNHVDRGARATKVYDRYEYDVEKRAALEAWGRKLHAILTRTTANVVAFGAR
jgi:integrase